MTSRHKEKEKSKCSMEMNSNSLILNKETEGLNWWIKIRTSSPICTYYFGAFDSFWEALLAKYGYLQDLKKEGAELNTIRIKQCKPTQLTIFDEELKDSDSLVCSTAKSV